MIHGFGPVPLALGVLPKAKPEMPLPDHRGVVTGLPEVGSHGRTVLLDQGGSVPVLHPALEPTAPAIPTRQNGIAGGRTNGGWGMSISKGHPLLGQLVQVRGGNLGFWVERLNVPVAHVVGENKNERSAGHRRAGSKEIPKAGRV